jgi:hypothetical protein
MAIRKFLTSVANVYGYDNNDAIVFTAKTLLDSSIDVTLGSTPVRGGRGNQLQYVYYHTGEMKFNLTDTQWNLQMLGATIGSDVGTGINIYEEESVTVASGGGASPFVLNNVTDTPLVQYGKVAILGWAVTAAGYTYPGTFTAKAFTSDTSPNVLSGGKDPVTTGDKVCVRYYALKSAASYVTVSANMIPKVIKLVMETQLNSADVTTNKIGVVQIIAPTVTLSGAFTISMKSDGVSNTPLTASALAYNGAPGTDACANEPYYAKIIEVISAANWYDNVIGLSVIGGDFSMPKSTNSTLNVYAVPTSGAAFKAPYGGEIDFALVGSPTATGTTINATTGVITAALQTGTAQFSAKIHGNTGIDTFVTVTVVP